MVKVKDIWVRITVIAVPLLLAAYMGNWFTKQLTGSFIIDISIHIISIVLIGEGPRFFIYYSRRLFKNRPGLRYFTLIPVGVLYLTVLLAIKNIILYYLITHKWDGLGSLESNVYVNGKRIVVGLWGSCFVNGIFLFLFFLMLYESLYYFARMRSSEKQKAQLEKDKLKAELFYLKEIVNPHFLFNSLNSLSSLIAEDPRQAEKFLDELTKVYRYLLRNNEADLTTLGAEIQFIYSYFHLLKTRYGNGIDFTVSIDPKCETLLLPPLTLQLLVENAVKHNKLQKENPLLIYLFTNQSHQLIVRNNIQKKDIKVDSTKVGLQNIQSKYMLLDKPGIVIDRTDDTFSVYIPLIETQTSGGSKVKAPDPVYVDQAIT